MLTLRKHAVRTTVLEGAREKASASSTSEVSACRARGSSSRCRRSSCAIRRPQSGRMKRLFLWPGVYECVNTVIGSVRRCPTIVEVAFSTLRLIRYRCSEAVPSCSPSRGQRPLSPRSLCLTPNRPLIRRRCLNTLARPCVGPRPKYMLQGIPVGMPSSYAV